MLESKEKDLKEELKRDINLKIVNIVATISFKQVERINLVALLGKFDNIKYNPEVFPGAILKLEKLKATLLIFSSGKMVVSGVKSVEILSKATKIVLQKLEAIGVDFEEPNVRIVNMIGTARITNFLNLELLSLYLENCLYDPTIFPAIIYHMVDPKASFLLFSTGKIICLGVNNEEILSIAISKLKKLLNQFKIDSMNSKVIKFEEPFFI